MTIIGAIKLLFLTTGVAVWGLIIMAFASIGFLFLKDLKIWKKT